MNQNQPQNQSLWIPIQYSPLESTLRDEPTCTIRAWIHPQRKLVRTETTRRFPFGGIVYQECIYRVPQPYLTFPESQFSQTMHLYIWCPTLQGAWPPTSLQRLRIKSIQLEHPVRDFLQQEITGQPIRFHRPSSRRGTPRPQNSPFA
jgi:hypothetical protein